MECIMIIFCICVAQVKGLTLLTFKVKVIGIYEFVWDAVSCIVLHLYRITRNFGKNLIFAIFANDLKTRKYVSAKNCTLKESLEVGTEKFRSWYQ